MLATLMVPLPPLSLSAQKRSLKHKATTGLILQFNNTQLSMKYFSDRQSEHTTNKDEYNLKLPFGRMNSQRNRLHKLYTRIFSPQKNCPIDSIKLGHRDGSLYVCESAEVHIS